MRIKPRTELQKIIGLKINMFAEDIAFIKIGCVLSALKNVNKLSLLARANHLQLIVAIDRKERGDGCFLNSH